jgi:hypothetical protein
MDECLSLVSTACCPVEVSYYFSYEGQNYKPNNEAPSVLLYLVLWQKSFSNIMSKC